MGQTDYLAEVEAKLPPDEPLELTRRLLSFDSVNPPGREGPVLDYLAELLGEWGFEVQRLETPSGRINLVAQTSWGGGGRRLFFNGHLDVVPPGEARAWPEQPFAGQVRQGRLIGRGACDMKGGVAAMLHGVRAALKAGGLGPAGTLGFHLVSDEEAGGSQGTGYLVERGLAKADAVVVGEPTSLEVVVAQKGTLWLKVGIRGRSAHGATPELGINAIEHMCRLIPQLQQCLDPAASHPLLGGPTLNLGRIAGGEKINMVADYCCLELDRRCLPNEDPDQFEMPLRRAAQAYAQQNGVQVEVERLMFAQPAEVPQDSPIARIALGAIERVLGRPGRVAGLAGFTDARFYVGLAGAPAILLGPGSIKQAHTTGEFVEVAQLRQAALIYATIIADFFQSS